MRNYVILAPPYGRSAGVRALYMLSDMLERKGFRAPVLCHTPSPAHHCMTDFTGRMQQEDQENLYDFRNDLKRCDRIEIYAANSSQPLCMMNTSEQIEAFMEDKLLLSDWKPAAIPQSIVLNYQYKCCLFQREDLYFAQGSGENKGQRGRLKNMADFFIYDQDHYIRISIQGFIMDFKMPSAVDIETYAGELTNG